MRKLFIVFLLGSVGSIISAKIPATLSDQAAISLITCDPASTIYTKFGHSGLRVQDPEHDIDYVFHWGLFNFDSPNFIMRFMLGQTDYEMGVFPTSYFLQEYINRGSSVYSQKINLNEVQKNDLWTKLWVNYSPENRVYRYNFIYDNCATRPYNMLLCCYGQEIELKYRYGYTTYRKIINEHVDVSQWVNLGIQIIIGSDADKSIGTQETVSFPLYTMEAVNNCYINDNGTFKHMAQPKETVFNAPAIKTDNITSWLSLSLQIIIPIVISALLIICYIHKQQLFCRYFTPVLYICYGIIGLLIIFLWFISSHPLVANNYNLLWFNPLGLILAPFLFFSGFHEFKFYTSAFLTLCSLAYIFVIIFDIQGTTIPLIAWWLPNVTMNILTASKYRNRLTDNSSHR